MSSPRSLIWIHLQVHSHRHYLPRIHRSRRRSRYQIPLLSTLLVHHFLLRRRQKKTGISTYSYCQKGPHDESHYFHKRFNGYEKQIAYLQPLLQKTIVSSPSSSTSQGSTFQSSSKSSTSTPNFGQGHALRASIASPSQVPWILDLGASHHMPSSQGVLSTIEASIIPHILMGIKLP